MVKLITLQFNTVYLLGYGIESYHLMSEHCKCFVAANLFIAWIYMQACIHMRFLTQYFLKQCQKIMLLCCHGIDHVTLF